MWSPPPSSRVSLRSLSSPPLCWSSLYSISRPVFVSRVSGSRVVCGAGSYCLRMGCSLSGSAWAVDRWFGFCAASRPASLGSLALVCGAGGPTLVWSVAFGSAGTLVPRWFGRGGLTLMCLASRGAYLPFGSLLLDLVARSALGSEARHFFKKGNPQHL